MLRLPCHFYLVTEQHHLFYPANVGESTIVSDGFKGGTRGAPIMPRDAVSRTANVGTVGTNGLNTHKNTASQ